MLGQWCYWKSFFSPEYCEHIIKLAKETIPSESATVYGAGSGINLSDTTRRSVIRWIKRTPEWENLFQTIEIITKQSNDEFFKFDYNELSSIQFTEYDASYKGEFKLHQDVLWLNGEPTERKLTFVIQLSDPTTYEGGDLTLEYVVQSPPPEEIKARGTVIFFPSLVFHQAHPVTSGTRYSLVGWWSGTHWK